MTVIGIKYLTSLSYIKHRVQGIRKGAFQENPETYIEKVPHGTCHYDKCNHQTRRRANVSVVTVCYDQLGRKKKVSWANFHANCLDALLMDERLTDLN